MRSIDNVAHGRDNNFDLIRFVAASAVILAHGYPLAGRSWTPFLILPNYDLGRAAVTVFFGISGLLVTKSYLRTHSIIDFAMARLMRVVPGLVIALVLTAFVLGPVVSSLQMSEYFTNKAIFGYVARNTSFSSMRYLLPGVFEDNPYKENVNGSIWTLPFEIRCYAAVVVLGVCGLLKGWGRVIFLAVYAAGYIALRGDWYGRPSPWTEFSLPFVLGGIFFLYRSKIPLNGWIFEYYNSYDLG